MQITAIYKESAMHIQLHVQEVDCQLQIPLEPVDVWSCWKYNIMHLILTDLWEKKDVQSSLNVCLLVYSDSCS